MQLLLYFCVLSKIFGILKKFFCRYKVVILLLVAVIFVAACSTSKDKWKNRKYHQITAHYNALWNGKQAYKEAVRTVDKSYKDDFTKLIPVTKLPDENGAKRIKSNTDRAIEKAAKVIKKHSMRFSGVEKNPEIDDAYLLIGKSCLISRDFQGAEAAFKYIISNWKRTESIYEPMIWLALTYTKQKKNSESEIVLKEVQKAIEDKKAPKKLKDFMYLVWAENDISQGKEAAALEKFDLRKKHLIKNQQDVRISFIKGQIYLQRHDYDRAYKAFQLSYRKAKDYNMQFASKLNQSLCFEPGDERSIKVVQDLESMLDKELNREYQDQIYYAIGEVYFRNRNMTIATKKWEQSVSASINNTTQKIASSIRCADTYYDSLLNYKKAAMYYDTALTLMSKDYPDYRRITDRQRVLSSLVKNLDIIERWDSLLAMSEMSEAELNKKIDKWINDYKIEQRKIEEKKRIEQAIAARNAQISSITTNNMQNRSSFYFYNPTTVQAGKIEFERKWGKRALEDNWRLEQKEEIGFEDDSLMAENSEDSLQNGESDKESTQLTPDKREYYTKDIPYTQGAKDTANAQIADALLEAGYIFWQGIGDMDKSIETFLDLHRRYPNHKNVLPSSFHLYKEYEALGDYPASNYYKNKILKEYPESEYAIMIQNPSFWDNNNEGMQKQDALYKKAYDYYANNEYRASIQAAQEGIKEIGTGAYIPRLKYVEALSKGKLYGADSLANALNMIIFNHPSSEITPIIEQQLQYLKENYDIKDLIKYDKQREDSILLAQKTNSADSIVAAIKDSVQTNVVNRDDILDPESMVYKYKDGIHYYILLADDAKFDADYLKEKLEEFNNEKFADKKLTVSANLFTNTYQIINVKKFSNRDEAFQYYDSISADSTLQAMNPAYYKHFIISLQNYATFYSKRTIDAYLKFFRLTYLNNRQEE